MTIVFLRTRGYIDVRTRRHFDARRYRDEEQQTADDRASDVATLREPIRKRGQRCEPPVLRRAHAPPPLRPRRRCGDDWNPRGQAAAAVGSGDAQRRQLLQSEPPTEED
jgi:hypothetical protein